MFGPVIGFGQQSITTVPAANIEDTLLGRYSSAVYGSTNGSTSGTEIVANFGGEAKILLKISSIRIALNLEYATKTGAGLGLGIPF